MKNKQFFIGWLVVVGCTSWLAGCLTADVDEVDVDEVDVEEESVSQDQLGPAILTLSPAKSKGYPNCGIVACPVDTTCAFDQSGEAVCMAPPGITCGTVDCGASFHCQMTTDGAVCTPGGSDS